MDEETLSPADRGPGDGPGGRNVRAWALRSLIASIAFSALVGIYVLLVGNFGELEGKVLITALSVSALSILAMSCGAAYEKRLLGWLPQAGMVASAVSFLVFMIAIWGELRVDEVWKTAASCGLAGVACAHACLLSLGRLAPRFRWVRWLGWACAFALAGLLIGLIWDAPDPTAEFVWRVIGTLAIVVAATTVAIPILSRLSGTHGAEAVAGDVHRCPTCGQRVPTPLPARTAGDAADVGPDR